MENNQIVIVPTSLPIDDLTKAVKTLNAKSPQYTKYFGYYEGDQPLSYVTTRVREIFKGLDVVFAENWCSVVIDSVKDRINMREVPLVKPDPTLQEQINDMLERNQLFLESDAVHEAALVCGEAFYIVWKDTDGKSEGFYNDPRLCHVFYSNENPRLKTFAAKWWVDDNRKIRVTLYYADHLEYYIAKSPIPQGGGMFDIGGELGSRLFDKFVPDGTTVYNPSHDLGQVPVFHFKTSQRKVISDLKSVTPLQDATNKLLTDMMVCAEYGAFKQRYIISASEIEGTMKNAPNEIWMLPEDTTVGEFSSMDLNNYLMAIDKLAKAISIITHTPKHFVLEQGQEVSGEALIAMEAPLNKKAQDRIDRFEAVWEDVIVLMASIDNISIKKKDFEVQFDMPETIQPRTQAEIRQIKVTGAGMSLRTALREEGRSPAYIEQALKDKETDDKAKNKTLANAMIDAKKNFNNGNQANDLNNNAQGNNNNPPQGNNTNA